MSIVTDWDALSELLKFKRQGKKVVFTNGCFDILHRGHVSYLQQARELGDFLVVGVNTDASVSSIKGPERPINSQESRMIVLDALKSVSFVTVFDDPTPERLINQLRPDVLVKGGDWKIEDIVGSSFVKSYGGSVHSLKFVEGFSTTGLIQKILNT